MTAWIPPHHTPDRFSENTGHTAILGPYFDRFVETFRLEAADCLRPKRIGYQQYWVGDNATIFLKGSLPWASVTVRIIEVYGLQCYRVRVVEFDGVRQCVAGVSIGDLIDLPYRYFFSIWAAEDTDGKQNHPKS